MKTDIVEYVEKIWCVPLTDCQKEFLREAYEAAENNMRLIYYPPREENRFQLVTLMALATILIAEERWGQRYGDYSDGVCGKWQLYS